MSERALPRPPAVGSHVPELAVSGLDRRAYRGEPRVLAFLRDGLGDPPSDALAAIRAGLRGLGAELVVVSAAGAWSVGADDPIEPRAAPSAELAAEVDGAAACYGVVPGDDAVFVIDGRGVLRFTHRLDPCGSTRPDRIWPSLAEALAIAGQAMHTRGDSDAVQRVLFTRREWTATCLVVGCATVFLAGCQEQRSRADDRRAPPADEASADLTVTLQINGKAHKLAIDPRTSLLDALRERIGLTGTKKGCDAGQCGACTVLAGGVRIKSCLTLAVMAQGKAITTIEGLAEGGALHPMQRAFVEHDGLQCGYCTPGQIMSAVGLVAEGHARTDDEVREQMSGNICRCGAYPNIIAAIQAARGNRG